MTRKSTHKGWPPLGTARPSAQKTMRASEQWPQSGGGSFTPTDLPDLAMWLDGADASTMYKTAGTQPFGLGSTPVTADADRIACWADKSGNGNHMNQSVLASRPYYKVGLGGGGNDLVSFTYGPNMFSTSPVLTQMAAVTIFYVARLNYDNDRGVLFATNSGSTREFRSYIDSGWDGPGFEYGMYAEDSAGPYQPVLPSDIGATFNQITNVVSGGDIWVRLNGVAGTAITIAGDGAFGNDYTRVGTSGGGVYPHDGYLCELIVVDGAASASDITACEDYLKAKWATP